MERDELEGKKKLRRGGLFRRVRSLVLLAAAIVCCAGLGFVFFAVATAPRVDVSDISPDGYRSTVLDDQGQEILTLAGEASNRVYVTLDQIPQNLQNAIIAIEDERFYQHHGIDVRGILRAFWSNLRSGSLSQGASTLTQQLIKNNVFSAGMGEKTALDKVTRKLQEQYLALTLERRVSKDWILENYLNTINLGAGAWGVETAALRYFGKEVSELTLSECAVLAGITKSPTGYNPLKNPEASRNRQTLVLDKMLELGFITQEECEDAKADDVYARISQNSTAAPAMDVFSYFEDAMVYQVLDDLMEQRGYSEEEAWRLIYRGGLTIESTQNTAIQRICEEEINRDSWYPGDEQATVVVMDPATGQVKAIVGGRGEKSGSLTLNRATASARQPGSTIKVVGAFAAALDGGQATLATVYDDAPWSYTNGTPIRNASGKYGGRTTIRRGIDLSVNVVALQCFQQVGIDTVWAYLKNFGFDHLTEEDKVEALALGGTHGGVTNLEVTAAYSAIANGGEYIAPTYYTRVLDREGKVLLENVSQRRKVLSSEAAALLTSAMEDVMVTGTGQTAAFSGVPLAGKSGTTTDMRDLWFVGYSPYYACGVWGGRDDYAAQQSSGYVKKIWKAVMSRAHEGLAYRDFSGTEALTARDVCTKCGNLAVEGLCDQTVQGDMTCLEYFAPGTEPAESCTCHVKVNVCTSSGQAAGVYCPVSGVEARVYLAEGTAGTADESAAAPESLLSETCTAHSGWWNWLFPDQTEPYDPQEPSDPSEEPYIPSQGEQGGDSWLDWRTWLDWFQNG